MSDETNTKVDFPGHTDYQIGAVTYQVAAHFNEDGKTLKSKIHHLLTEETKKSNRHTFAADKDNAI